MSSKHSKKINKKVEGLCELGCTQVNQLIADANNGVITDKLSGFSSDEVEQVIDELSQIMAIYDDDSVDKST